MTGTECHKQVRAEISVAADMLPEFYPVRSETGDSISQDLTIVVISLFVQSVHCSGIPSRNL